MALHSGQQLKVAVVFEEGSRIRPVWFERQRRRHHVRETTYTWRERVGEATLLHFAVSDGTALFELVYNTATQGWALAGIEAEG